MKSVPRDQDFRKSSFSGQAGSECVSVATSDDSIYVRDTKDQSKVTLRFTKPEWEAFIKGVKGGEFDV